MPVPATTPPPYDVRPRNRAGHHRDRTAAPEPAAQRGRVPTPSVAPGLLALLRCPRTGGTLIPVGTDRLMSDRPFRDGVHPVYPITEGIPCLGPEQ